MGDPLGPLHQGEELLVGRLANVRHRVVGLQRGDGKVWRKQGERWEEEGRGCCLLAPQVWELNLCGYHLQGACSVHTPVLAPPHCTPQCGAGIPVRRKTLSFEILPSNTNHLLSKRTVSLNTPNPCLKELLTAQVGL